MLHDDNYALYAHSSRVITVDAIGNVIRTVTTAAPGTRLESGDYLPRIGHALFVYSTAQLYPLTIYSDAGAVVGTVTMMRPGDPAHGIPATPDTDRYVTDVTLRGTVGYVTTAIRTDPFHANGIYIYKCTTSPAFRPWPIDTGNGNQLDAPLSAYGCHHCLYVNDDGAVVYVRGAVGGHDWTFGPVTVWEDGAQPCLRLEQDGSLLALCESADNTILRRRSRDHGRTWADA